MKNATAMILAGGRGTRMDILCHRRPKPILHFGGRFRVIDFSLSNCLHSHINTVAVLVDYRRHLLSDYLQEWSSVNSSNNHLTVLEPHNGSYKGTADAIYQNIDFLTSKNNEMILVLAGDHVYRMDYRKMLAFHERMDADVTIGVIRVPIEQANRFGIVTTDSNGMITDFVEKPRIPVNNMASMGIYIFKKQVLVEHLVKDSTLQDSVHDFGKSIMPGMVKTRKVCAYKFDGYWQDIGTVAAYYEANMELLSELPSLSLYGKWSIYSRDNYLLPLHISRNDNTRYSIIGQGCIIKGRVENSILSPGVMVGDHAVVKNSIIMPNTVVGKSSIINRCIVDEDVNVGEFCYIGFGASLFPVDWDITVLGKGVSVPDGTAIGRNCRVLPEVMPADFTSKALPAGSIVSQR